MSATRIPSRLRRLNKVQKISVAGVSALGVAALTFSLVPSNADAEIAPQAAAAAAPVAFTNATGTAQAKTVQNSMIEQHSTAEKLVKAADAAKAKAAAETKAKAAKAKAASEAKARRRRRREGQGREGRQGQGGREEARVREGQPLHRAQARLRQQPGRLDPRGHGDHEEGRHPRFLRGDPPQHHP